MTYLGRSRGSIQPPDPEERDGCEHEFTDMGSGVWSCKWCGTVEVRGEPTAEELPLCSCGVRHDPAKPRKDECLVLVKSICPACGSEHVSGQAAWCKF